MATRRTPIRQWEIDKAIGTRVMNRLLRHVMHQNPDKDPKHHMMTDAQVRAALGILKKYIPDLKHIEHTGNPDAPVIQRIERVIIDPNPPADSQGIRAAAGPE